MKKYARLCAKSLLPLVFSLVEFKVMEVEHMVKIELSTQPIKLLEELLNFTLR